MSLKTEVKVSHISNLSDARYCAGMGVRYLGFSLNSNSEHYVDPETLKTFKEWIVGPIIVGELSNLEPFIKDKSRLQEDIDCIEISEPSFVIEAAKINLPVILKLDIARFQSVQELEITMTGLKDSVLFFLMEKSTSSLIQNEDIKDLAARFKIMIGFGIDKQNIHTWIDGTDVFGISLKGGTEIKPGFKDYDELANILEEIEVD